MVVLLTAFWLGLLTSISPCPLATNIASISFISKKITHPKSVLIAGLFYSIGRMIAYTTVGFIVMKSLTSIPATAMFLQKYMNILLGPILILVGLFLVEALKINIKGLSISRNKIERLSSVGAMGSLILGFVFALSFCPVSAALFFGSLIPLSLSSSFGLLLPLVYGLATSLPVIIFALLLALGFKNINSLFTKAGKVEHYARVVTGLIFILAGTYYLALAL